MRNPMMEDNKKNMGQDFFGIDETVYIQDAKIEE